MDDLDYTITKRELLASISIIAGMLVIGILISNKISEYQMDKNEIYNKAAKIESTDIFEYGMRTNVGNAFVYGELKAIDTVTYPEIGGEYMHVKKVEEHYTKHTRQVRHTRRVNGRTTTYYTTETYWTWDEVHRESLTCDKVSFLDVIFDNNKFSMPEVDYICTIKESSRVRHKYYGSGLQYTGSIFTELKEGTITDNTYFYRDMSIDELLKHKQTSIWIFVFWVAWIVLIAVVVYGFYYIDNEWLE